MKYYWGIDPGKTGAVAIIGEDGFIKFLSDYQEPPVLLPILKGTQKAFPCTMCALEKAQAMPKQGVVGVFNYGVNFGSWMAMLAALSIPFMQIPPAKWKKTLVGIGDKKDKDLVRLSAIQRFPDATDLLKRKKDHNRAEAIWLANWMRENH